MQINKWKPQNIVIPQGHTRDRFRFQLWQVQCHVCLFVRLFIYLFIYLQRGEGRKIERERNINVWLLFARPQLGTWPATQARALTVNRTGDPLVLRWALNSLSHTSQGQCHVFKNHNLSVPLISNYSTGIPIQTGIFTLLNVMSASYIFNCISFTYH